MPLSLSLHCYAFGLFRDGLIYQFVSSPMINGQTDHIAMSEWSYAFG
jgi:hypothetical protein